MCKVVSSHSIAKDTWLRSEPKAASSPILSDAQQRFHHDLGASQIRKGLGQVKGGVAMETFSARSQYLMLAAWDLGSESSTARRCVVSMPAAGTAAAIADSCPLIGLLS